MTKQEIQDKIRKAEAGLTNKGVPDGAKTKLREQIDVWKSQLADMDKPVPAAVEKAQEAASTTKKEQEGMSEAEIRSRIAKIKAGLNNPKFPDGAKPKLRKQLAELQESIGEKAEEEKEVKAVAKVAEKKIKEADKQIASPKTPAKQKAALKKRVAAVKKVVKEAKADAEVRRRGRPRKEAAAKAAPAKRGRPAKAAPAAKKAVVKRATKAQVKKVMPKPVVAKKRVVKRATKSAAKVKTAVSSLEKLVRRTAELRAMYAGKGVDLDRDAARGSKRPGWRIAGSNRRPTKADIKAGRAYWEARPNRADVQKSNYPKLAKGGMMSHGGETSATYTLKISDSDWQELSSHTISEETYKKIMKAFTKETQQGWREYTIDIYEEDDDDDQIEIQQVNQVGVNKIRSILRES